MDSDRIAKTQAEIDRILPSKPEYIVTTSDYTNMRQRLLTMENSPQAGGRQQAAIAARARRRWLG